LEHFWVGILVDHIQDKGRDSALSGDTACLGVLIKESLGYFLISSYQSGFALDVSAFHAQKLRCFFSKRNQ
jgi:hypothetical protein